MDAAAFVDKWRKSRRSERSASQEHFLDLCELLKHPKPGAVDPKGLTFTTERRDIATERNRSGVTVVAAWPELPEAIRQGSWRRSRLLPQGE